MQLPYKIAAAYIRASTDEQQAVSPESQLEKITEYANKNGYDLPPELIFRESEGVSGRKASRREAFNRMIGVAKQKPAPFSAVLVWKFSRFARNQEESVFYKSMLRRQGIEVISISEPIIDGPFGQLIERIIEWMDEYYSIRLGEEVKRSMTMLAHEGKPLSVPPFGYQMVEGALIVDAVEAPLVREIFRRAAQGDAILSIAQSLNDRGIRTHRGSTFENRTINYILQNPVYIGKIRWNPTERTRRDFKHPDLIIADGRHEPLIDMDTWEKVQTLMENNRMKHNHYAKHQSVRKSWLTGLFRCSACGGSLIQGSATSLQCGNYSRGRCKTSHYIAKEAAAQSLAYQLRMDADRSDLDTRMDPEQKRRMAERVNPDLALTLTAIERRLSRLREAYLAGVESLESYSAAKSELDARAAAVRLEIEKEQKSIKRATFEERRARILKAAAAIEDPNATDDEKYTAVHDVVSFCTFFRATGTIEITYNLM